MKTFVGMACVALTALATTANAQTASFAHIDRLATQLEGQIKHLMHEVHVHYRHTPQFAHLDHDAHEMVEAAKHIHDVVHRGANLSHLQRDVEQLDRLYHHMEDLVRHMYGRDLRHIRKSMAAIGQTLHHLRADLAAIRAAQAPRRPLYRPHPGGWSIRFGW